MTIYKYNGDVLYDAPITESAIIKRSLMGDYYIEMSFNVADVINIGRGCYILHENNKFAIMSNVTPERKNGGYHYTLRFEAQQGIMKLCKCFWRTYDTGSLGEQVENIEVSFNNTTSLSQFAKLIVDNVNAFLGETRWEAGAIDETLDEAIKAVSFDGDSCWDAVANIAETFDVEWWTEETTEKVILYFGKLENGEEVEFSEGDIVSSISYNKGDDSSYGTRFYVFGSTKNLPEDYSSTEQGGITNHISEKRLHLPDGIKYIDSSEFLTKQNIVEKVVYFDDIFPTNIERVTIVTETLEEVIEGQMGYVYTCFCMESPFTLADVIDIDDIHCTFTSGSLAGQSFKVGIDATTGKFNKKFKIIPNVDVNSGVIIPNENYHPESSDRFILEGVRLPKGRITEAENELLKVGKEYAKKNSSNTEIFKCVTNPVYCHNNECNYDLGRKVRVKGRASRIQGYEKKLYDPYQASYSVGDNSAYSRLSSLEKAIKKSSYGDRVGLEANIIRSKSDNTTPSDYNVFSALASEKYFLHKEKGGIIKGETDFQAGIKIFGDQFYDKEKKRYYLRGDLIVEGGVAMYANGSDVDVPSIFDSLPIDRETIKRDGNGALYVDEKALSISGGGSGGGVADSVYWSNVIGKPSWIGSTKPTYKYSEIEERPDLSVYAKLSDIPSLNGYATQSWVEGKGYLLASTASNTYQPKITSSNKLAYNLISDAPDLSVYFLKSSFTKANIKSTLGISDWALASAKPTYKYSEISNTPDFSVYALNTDLAKKWTQNDAKIANWDSAYSWGNHANAGYAKASDVTNEFKNYVKLAGDSQSITAQHNFANGLKIGGISLRKVDNYLYLDSSLVLSGGVTMYGDDGTTVKPIWESIPFDRTTIDWVNGKWTVVGGVGSGGISEEFLNVTLQGYQTKITTTNKLAYSLISGTPDLSVYFLSSNFTKANIKTTLGISDWALASAKPTYTASEVGALGVNGTAASSLKMTPEYLTDLNNATPWRFFDMRTGYGSTDGNKPNIAWVSGITGTVAGSGNYRWQIAGTTGNARPYFRQESNGTWGNWQRLAFTIDLPTKLSHLTDDVVAGKYLPITGGTINGSLTATSFIGNLMGNADSATKLATARTIWGQSFDGTGNISGDIKSDNIIPTASGSYTLGTADNQWYAIYSTRLHSKAGSDLYIGANNDNNIVIKKNGNVAIGGITADAKLHVHGTAKFEGDTTFSSKVVIGTIPVYQSADGTLFVDANVVFRGGVAMYGDTAKTINEE